MANRPFSPSRCINRQDRGAIEAILPNFETIDEVRQWQARDISALRQNGSEAAIRLAERLHACTLRRPCHSAACRFDQREYRIWLATAVARLLLSEGWRSGQGWVASIVPEVSFGLDGFTVKELRAFKQRVRHGLSHAGLDHEVVIGGVDFSINTSSTDPIGYIQPHTYLLLPFLIGRASAQIALKRAFPASEQIPRPVRMRRLNDVQAAVTYAYKSHFVRRTSYVNAVGSRCTRDFPLRGDALVNLLLSLDRLPTTARLILMSAQRRGCHLEVCRDRAQRRSLRALGAF